MDRERGQEGEGEIDRVEDQWREEISIGIQRVGEIRKLDR